MLNYNLAHDGRTKKRRSATGKQVMTIQNICLYALTRAKKTFIVGAFFMILSSCNLQQKLLYYPSSSLPSQEELADLQMQFWPSGPDNYRGFIGTATTGATKGTVIVFHGNAGTAADREYYPTELGPLGYRVILAEYPGYGARKGELGEASFLKDAQLTVRLAAEKYEEPLFLLGESLGCGVVSGVAKDRSLKLAGLLLITPWDTLLAVAKAKFPLLPLRWLMKDRYDNRQNLDGFSGRIAILGAEHDEVIPIAHARALYDSLGGQKKMWTLPGARHNDWPMSADARLWREVMDFLSVPGLFPAL